MILALSNITGLGAGDTADVIAHMGITHCFLIDTASDHTAADAGNTADVCNRIDRFRIGKILQCNIRKFHGILLGCGVHTGQIGTRPDNTGVFSGNAAHKMLSVDLSFRSAGLDQTRHTVAAGNTAYTIAAGKFTGKTAVQNLALITAGNAADFPAAAAGVDLSAHLQIGDHRRFRQMAEQAFSGAIIGKMDTLHSMTIAQKGAAENGDTDKVAVRKVQIRFQAYLQVLTVGVQAAIPGEGQKLLRAGNGKFERFCLFRRLRVNRHGHAEQQHKTHQQTHKPLIHGHRLLPVLPSQRMRSTVRG